MNIRYRLPCFVMSLCCSVAQAGGVPEGVYAGVAVGASDGNASTANLVSNPARCSVAGAACSVDQRNTAWKVYAGYPLSEQWAVEGEYADLGKVLKGSVSQGGINDSYTQKTAGFGVSLVGKVKPKPQSPLSVYGKAGVFHWVSKADASFSPAVAGFGASASRKDNGTNPMFGLGVEYALAPKLAVRAGWDRYLKVGKRTVLLDEGNSSWSTLDTDVDLYSVGLSYRF